MRPNRLKQAIKQNIPDFGPNLQIPSPWLVEIIGGAGFDYVMLDCEHGLAHTNLSALITAADAAGITPLVRLPSHERGPILHALELGAGGIQVAMVETPEDAHWLAHQAKYAPIGGRGYSNTTRAANFGAIPEQDYVRQANDETLLVVQLETRQGIENAGEIAQIPGIDMVFIGPGDLSQSLGFPGQSRAPQVVDAMIDVINRIAQHGVPVSTSAFSADDVRFWTQHGVACFLTSSMHPIRQTFERLHAELRSGAVPVPPERKPE